MATQGAAAGAAAVGVAASAFGYNRGNYMFDAEFRWERFTSAREYANQQSEQFRGDIRNLAALTVKKNTLWATTSTLCMALCVALYCAGRLGLHGPSPPTWIMGLWLTNNAASFAFMALTTFLALHASFRAQAASVHLLTRKTRVPVPTLKQLDEARRFASEFEQQGVSDILRIPYLGRSGAPRTDEAVYDGSGSDDEGGRSGRRGGRSSSAPPAARSGCSSWIREEFAGDREGTAPPSDLPADAAPEHFRLYAAVQQEFYQHDIYARVGIFLGFIHYFQSLCFYGLGHINVELRAFYVAYGCTFVIAVLMALVLRFDIIPPQGGRKQLLPKCEYFGPLAVLPAAIGMSLDFRVEYDPTAIALTWVFIFIAYIMQLIYSLRILEVVLPDEKFAGLGERLGAAWLPEGWNKVPSSFYHVLYAVAPPTELQPGQHDIVREVKEGGAGAYSEVLGAAKDVSVEGDSQPYHKVHPVTFSEPQVQPWKLMAAIAFVLPCSWVFLTFGMIVDVAIGEQALVTAPHWSRPPMSRQSLAPHELGTPLGFPWASGAKPFIPEQMAWHEEKRHADEYSIGRRLSGADTHHAVDITKAVHELVELMPDASSSTTTPVDSGIVWPEFFEPRLLACGAGGRVAALSARGFGAAAALPAAGPAEAFRLGGLLAAGQLVGATWGHDGLLVVAQSGALFLCPGERPAAGGSWPCVEADGRGLPSALPVAAGSRVKAAATRVLDGVFHAAIVSDEAPEHVALYFQEAGSWLPAGELRLPAGGGQRASLAFGGAGELLVATGTGQVLRYNLHDGSEIDNVMHHIAQTSEEIAWQAACGLDDARTAHLTLKKTAMGWTPAVLTSSPMSRSADSEILA